MKTFSILSAAIIIIILLPLPVQFQTPIISTPKGGPLGGIIIAANSTIDYSQPSAIFATNLNTYFVAYRSSLNEIIVTLVSPTGTATGNFTAASAREFYNRSNPKLAYNTQEHQILVVWEDYNSQGISNIRGKIFNSSGSPITAEIPVCTSSDVGAQCFHPSVAYSAVQNRYLVVWQLTSGPEASGSIEGEFISKSGVGEMYIPVRLAEGNNSFAQPDVAFNHRRNEYLVTFQLTDCATFPCNTDILGHRVNYLGDVLDEPNGIIIGYRTVPESHPAVAAFPDPTENKCWMVAWTLQYDDDPLDRDIYHNLLNCDGIPQGGTGWGLISTDLDDYAPTIAFSESIQKYLVAWTLTTNVPLNTSTIIGIEMDISGDPAGPTQLIGGWFGTQATVAAGPLGDFLTAYTESVLFGKQQIIAYLWGNRIYLPMIIK